jgi:hypothetical protein
MQTHADQPRDHGPLPAERQPHAIGERPGPPRASWLLHLQRWAGNRAVASRFASDAVVQRDAKPASLAEAMEGSDPDALIPFRPFPPLSPDQLRKICRLVIDKNTWIGPDNELSLESAWRAVGGQQAALDGSHWALWKECEGYGAEVKAVPWMRETRTSYADRIRATALRNVDNNMTAIQNEAKRLGIAVDSSSQPAPTRQSDEAVAKQRELAHQIEDAHAKQKELRNIPVGYEERSWGTGSAPGGVDQEIEPDKPVKFNPDTPPPRRSDPEPNPAKGIAKHEVVKAVHDEITRAVAGILENNPALYAIAARGGTASILGEDTASVRKQMTTALQDVLANATKTKSNIETRSLHFTALEPARKTVVAEPQYTRPFTAELVKAYHAEELEAEGDAAALVNLLTIALMTAVTAASGGTAAPVVAAMISLAASTGMAAVSWNEWAKLETAAKSTVSNRDAIVTQEQADAAALTALVSTAGALLDVYGAGRAARAAAGSRAAVTSLEGRVSDVAKLRKIAEGAALVDAREVVERSLTTFGPATTLRNVGGWQKVTATLGGGSPAMAQLSAWRTGAFRAAEEAGMKAAVGQEGEAARVTLAVASGIEQIALGEALDAVIEVFSGDAAPGAMGHIGGRVAEANVRVDTVADRVVSKHANAPAVQRSPIEIVTLPISDLKMLAMSGTEFEEIIRRYLASGHFSSLGLPKNMTILDAKVHGGGHGFDGFGIAKDGPLIRLYNFECKFVAPGGQPELSTTKAGLLQGSPAWNAYTAERILSGANPYADETLEDIATAVRRRIGRFDERILEDTLVEAARKAKTIAITPIWADARVLRDAMRGMKGMLVRVVPGRRR